MSVFDILAQAILAFILTVLFLKHTVSAIGKPTIVDHAWNLYTYIASKAGHPKFKQLASKRAELVKINRERKSISAQDQYARWTKLNRAFDKLSTEVTALAEEVSSEKGKIGKLVNFSLLLCTTAPVWFARYWYRKRVLLYFPAGVLPYPVEWVLALPFTKTGGLGLTIWMFAVNNFLLSATSFVKFVAEPAVEKPVPVAESGKGAAGASEKTEAI